MGRRGLVAVTVIGAVVVVVRPERGPRFFGLGERVDGLLRNVFVRLRAIVEEVGVCASSSLELSGIGWEDVNRRLRVSRSVAHHVARSG